MTNTICCDSRTYRQSLYGDEARIGNSLMLDVTKKRNGHRNPDRLTIFNRGFSVRFNPAANNQTLIAYRQPHTANRLTAESGQRKADSEKWQGWFDDAITGSKTAYRQPPTANRLTTESGQRRADSGNTCCTNPAKTKTADRQPLTADRIIAESGQRRAARGIYIWR